MEWLDSRGILIDLDGTLVSGNTVLDYAGWLVEQARGRYVIVSNNAEHTPVQLHRWLQRLGLHVEEDRMVLAGATALEVLADERPGASIMLVGSLSLRAHARKLGFTLTEDRPDVVVVMRDRKFTYDRLAAAANALHRGATMVLACPDTSHPAPDASLVPEAGALAAAILSCAGRVAPDIVIGKPQPLLYRKACGFLGVAPEEAVMIGDNPATDGLGATRLGMKFIHVAHGIVHKDGRTPFIRYAANDDTLRPLAGG